MNLETLCRRIDLPEEAARAVLHESPLPEERLRALTLPERARQAYQCCKEYCAPEKRGLDLLSQMLRAALITYTNYQRQDIGEDIFLATMKCFSRFVQEHRVSFGVYGFDRGWWTYRQLSMRLFRTGELEYEFRPDEQCIHLHIPSDAVLELPACEASLSRFRRFAEEQSPAWAGWPVVMESWLLSPALDALLPDSSNIRRFKNCFDINSWDRTNQEFLQWVYGRTGIPYSQLPERTSLQRSMKTYLTGGGAVGSAAGVLRGFGRSR